LTADGFDPIKAIHPFWSDDFWARWRKLDGVAELIAIDL
jgi:hypothetical protein